MAGDVISLHAVELAAVERLRNAIAQVSWFATAGQPLTNAERADTATYLAGLGIEAQMIRAAAGWAEVSAITRDPAWDRGWWDAEDRLRLALLAKGRTLFSDAQLMSVLSRVTDTATDVLGGVSALSAANAGLSDTTLIKVAAGAATQACYQAALVAITAGAPDHPFAVKYRLYEAGRWPLGLVRGTFHLL